MNEELINILKQALVKGDIVITLTGSVASSGEPEFKCFVGFGEYRLNYNTFRGTDDWRAYPEQNARIWGRSPDNALEDAVCWLEDTINKQAQAALP